jgi:integrase
MARLVGKLTARKVATATPPPHRRAITLSDGGNLFLQVTRASGGHVRRSWLFCFERDGVRRSMGLGNVATRGLADARRKARDLRLQLLDGIDPLEAKRRARMAAAAEKAKAVTFKQCAEMYVAAHMDAWHNAKHRAQWKSALENYCYPKIGGMAVADIDTDAVILVIEPIWRRIPETASRVRGRIEKILDFATVRKFRSGDNPARYAGHLSELLPSKRKLHTVEHFKALDYREMGAFMIELRSRKGEAARALELLALCAARTSEVTGALWSEIDLKAKTWVIPASRMKSAREHAVPLSDRAVAILEALPRDHGNSIFKLSATALWRTLRDMRPVTPHGFRSSFRDWAAECTNYPREICEAALAHAVGSQVERAYARTSFFDKRRQLMDEWARFCSEPARSGENVVPIRDRVAP